MENLLNLIFPPKCLFCDFLGEAFCKKCLGKCEKLGWQYCLKCGEVSLTGKTHTWCLKENIPNELISIYKYDGLVRLCIKRSKYGNKEFMALKTLVREGLSVFSNKKEEFKDFLAVPVPCSKEKLRKRGFNQAEVISNELSRFFLVKSVPNALKRTAETTDQFKLGRRKRFENVRGAFLANRPLIQGKNILLVDDICTTGATLLEAGKTLYLAGANEVVCFTLAKRVFEDLEICNS